jgi:hypothetical protein
MTHPASKESAYRERSCPEQRIEATDRLLRQTVERLSRDYPARSVGDAACNRLSDLRPHLEDGLSALEDIKRRRELTDRELSRQRAFRMVLMTGIR